MQTMSGGWRFGSRGRLLLTIPLLFTSACSTGYSNDLVEGQGGEGASEGLGGAGVSEGLGGADGGSATAIEFSKLRSEDVGASSATIRFETNIETTCEVEFGVEESTLDSFATDPDMDEDDPYDTLHRVPLEDLPEGERIYYRARATSAAGKVAYSEVQSFLTLSSEEGTSPLEGMTNVALLSAGAAVSSVSSNYGDAADEQKWGANAAFDGQMSSEWSSAGDGDDAWVTLDLGEARELRGLSFRSREMSDGSAIIQEVRLIVDDDTDLGFFATPDPGTNYEFVFAGVVSARKVRIEATSTSGGNTGAREIGLYVLASDE